jgi:shikimate dehydrogenase
MIKLGLIGFPVSHSLSPKIQNAALQASGLEGDYSLFAVEPDDMKALKNLMECVRSGEMTGFNVTIPHKQNVIPMLDELTPTAQAIGAVNIIYKRGDKLIGENTDAPGFLADLKKFLTTAPSGDDPGTARDLLSKSGKCKTQRHGDFNVLVLGAGGSARSVVYALVNDGWHVSISARRLEQAQQLSEKFPVIHVKEYNISSIQLSNFHLIVNTTPIGMTPNVDQSPLPAGTILPRHAKIYDLVYNPRETKLVHEARAQGLQATNGLGMLVEQAALGFTLWTGIRLPVEIFRSAVE